MRALQNFALGLAISVLPLIVTAQPQPDIDAINQLIDRYGELEDAMDMTAQAGLMSADRVWIAQGGGRRTDQAANMSIQQAQYDQLKKTVRGIQTFTEDRDRLIKFYGDGSVAVASFYRYTTAILPASATPDGYATPPPAVATLVLEKRDGEWKIVHTHFSNLAPAGN